MLEGTTQKGQQIDKANAPAEHSQLLRAPAGVARLEQVLFAGCDGHRTKCGTCEVLDENMLAEASVAFD